MTTPLSWPRPRCHDGGRQWCQICRALTYQSDRGEQRPTRTRCCQDMAPVTHFGDCYWLNQNTDDNQPWRTRFTTQFDRIVGGDSRLTRQQLQPPVNLKQPAAAPAVCQLHPPCGIAGRNAQCGCRPIIAIGERATAAQSTPHQWWR